MGAPPTFVPQFATSADGTRVGWERVGSGPPVVVLHGGTRAGKHYRALASALADRFTLHLVDRRGRGLSPINRPEAGPQASPWSGGLSGPPGAGDPLEQEIADLAAVMKATGAEDVFGHSAGAVISLEAALRLPIRRLALYEPPLVGSLPLHWVPDFEEALRRDRPARAMALLVKGLQMGPPDWMPLWLMELPAGLLMRIGEGRELAPLLRTMPRDVAMARSVDPRAERYAAVRCPTLLLGGSKSPAYLKEALEVLARTVPGARRVELPQVGHNAPDMEAPAAVAAELGAFFAG